MLTQLSTITAISALLSILCDFHEENSDYINHKSIAQNHLETMTSSELDANWKLNEFFGSVFVINLPHATLRLEQVKESLKSIGVQDFEVLPAIDGRKDVDESLWKKWIGIGQKLTYLPRKVKRLLILSVRGNRMLFNPHSASCEAILQFFSNSVKKT
jgi:hypothetical protein